MKSNFIHKKNNIGFSLIEALIYTAIFITVISSITFFISNIQSSRLRAQIMLEVNNQGSGVLRHITQSVRNSTLINYPVLGATSTSLSLATGNPITNPTVFSQTGEVFYVTEGLNSSVALTNNKVKVTNLSFSNLSRLNTPGVVEIRFTLSNSASSTLQEQQYSADFYGTASVRK